MGVRDPGVHPYGVWKAHPVTYQTQHVDNDPTPHMQLYFSDGQDRSVKPDESHRAHQTDDLGHTRQGLKKHGPYGGPYGGRNGKLEIPGLCRAAINIKSGDSKDSRLVYWVNRTFDDHPMVNDLKDLSPGFHFLEDTKPSPTATRLDFIRSNLFNVHWGRILPHDKPGENNDIIDVLEPEIGKAIDEEADIYLFGEQLKGGTGIHNVHMNQGNIEKYQEDDGVYQDGGLLINYPSSGQWVGVFLGFASQAVHTDDETGHATSSETWAHYLSPESKRGDLLENSVSIVEASLDTERRDPSGTRRTSVTLSNMTDHKIPLSNWKVKNSAGESQILPQDAELGVTGTSSFDLPDFAFSKIGDTITLLNEQGLKVDGVSYNSYPRGVQGQSVVFAH